MTGQRERLIVELLRCMEHAQHPAGSSGIRSSDGSRVPLLPHEQACSWLNHGGTCSCWLSSVAELQRCLRLAYKTERRLFRAVYERYLACDRRPKQVQIKHRRPVLVGNMAVLGEPSLVDLNKRGDGYSRMMVEQWRPDIQDQDVDAGVAWIAREFRGSPKLRLEWRLDEVA